MFDRRCVGWQVEGYFDSHHFLAKGARHLHGGQAGRGIFGGFENVGDVGAAAAPAAEEKGTVGVAHLLM